MNSNTSTLLALWVHTVLRPYGNNQAAGIIADEVFELKMEPRNWGQLVFE